MPGLAGHFLFRIQLDIVPPLARIVVLRLLKFVTFLQQTRRAPSLASVTGPNRRFPAINPEHST